MTLEAKAAVALIETTQGPPAVLLIRRASRDGDPWAGHWALPGGRRQHDDADLLATALRETREECGITIPRESLLRDCGTHHAGRHVGHPIPVAVYHFRIDHRPRITPEPTEVAASHWCPLVYLRDRSAHRRGCVNRHQPHAEYPYLPVQDHPLWGFTYGVVMDWIEHRRS